MGLLIDLVPNHMSVDDPRNTWWQDVLENGPGSPFGKYFDIDWNPPKEALEAKCCWRCSATNSERCWKTNSCESSSRNSTL